MRPRTEDLLAIRDGEPLDAHAFAVIETSPMYAREVERLRDVRSALQALPAFEPPPGVFARVLEAKEAGGVRRSRWLRVAAGAGVAAAVATATLVYVANTGGGLQGPAATTPTLVVDNTRSTPAYATAVPVSYVPLAEESARLERILAALPARRPLMTGATASTIAGLEDRIAFVDEQLSYGAADRLPARQRVALWSDRVELMNALVNVRLAEAQSSGF
jgi:hypothetical protein